METILYHSFEKSETYLVRFRTFQNLYLLTRMFSFPCSVCISSSLMCVVGWLLIWAPDQFWLRISVEIWGGIPSCVSSLGQVDPTESIPLPVQPQSRFSNVKARLGHEHLAVEYIRGNPAIWPSRMPSAHRVWLQCFAMEPSLFLRARWSLTL